MASKRAGKKTEQRNTKANGRSPRKRNSRSSGVYITEAEEPEEETMSPVRQATLVNYHLAIEDSVDFDKIWDNMLDVFDENEQQDIEDEPTKKEQIKKMLDLLPMKNDAAFDQLVTALRPDYKWLAIRLQEGVKDEEKRIGKLGKGIKRKIALALLTARISERQKDNILQRVTSVVESEMTHKAMRVNIPDHRAAAQLDRVHRTIQEVIREEVDPLLYGEEHVSTWEAEDYDETIDVLKTKMEELQVFKECYHAVSITETNTSSLPSTLLTKIEEINTKIRILKQEKQEAATEAMTLSEERDKQEVAISKLEQYNRSLELENRTLEEDKEHLEQTVKKLQSTKKLTEKDYHKVEDENRNLKSELQLQQDRLADISLRIRSLDDQNSKLIRDNQKLATANSKLRRNSRANTNNSAAAIKSENKRLTNDRTKLRNDLQRLEADKRRLYIKAQKLEAENQNLKEQKKKLLSERRRFQDENKFLRDDAKRLAIGKYKVLPPIDEDGYSDENDSLASSRSRRGRRSRASRRTLDADSYSREQPATRKIARAEISPEKQKPKSDTPWNKYTYKGDEEERNAKTVAKTEKQSSSKDTDTTKAKADGTKDKANTGKDTKAVAGVSKDKNKDSRDNKKDSKDKDKDIKDNKKDSKDKDKDIKDNKKDSKDKSGTAADEQEAEKPAPAYMMPTAASRRKNYNEDEPTPRRAAAWK